MKRLAHENLVAVFPRRGSFASEINITDLADISDVRVQLEGHAAYRAASGSRPRVARSWSGSLPRSAGSQAAAIRAI